MRIRAPGKINLFLRVTGKRPDGYHDLISLMCCVGIYDELELAFGQRQTRVICSHPDVPEDETNLAWRAAELFLRTAAITDTGVHITIKKVIPVGAGLGGGSSNAAAVLTALNSRFDAPVSPGKLHDMARLLGADVPFFLYKKPAVATGIGDILDAFDNLPSFPVVIVYPSVAVSTSQVYKNLNLRLTKNKKKNSYSVFKMDWDCNAPRLLHNDLEDAASELCPDIRRAKQALIAHGAAGALMTGSGSSVFGLFNSPAAAEKASGDISAANRSWRLLVTRTLI
jgi:4-diphosphocytidyl-2-C-methyl-D-erythritol kinase